MDQPLNGIYRVSFDLEIRDNDSLSQSDLAQLFTEGMNEGLANKVANLQIDRLDKEGKSTKRIKVGDIVRVKESIAMRASFYEDDGYVFVGKPSDISNAIGSKEIILEAGSKAYVNQIHKSGEVDLIDVDRPITASLRVDDLGTEISETVSIDFVTVSAEQIEKVDAKGDK